jgi:SAM-dependent methyltransferase
MTSLVYKSSGLYELAMVLLYGRHYPSRYTAIAELIPDGSSVLDLCCGPALLYQRYLRAKSVQYTGLDINAKFIDRLIRRGGCGKLWDLRSDEPLPEADYVIMQASLYHFLPDASPIVNRMLQAANKRVIIAEPIHNLATSNSRLLAWLGRLFTNPGSGEQSLRFNEASLADFFSNYSSQTMGCFPIAGGREQVYVLSGEISASSQERVDAQH